MEAEYIKGSATLKTIIIPKALMISSIWNLKLLGWIKNIFKLAARDTMIVNVKISQIIPYFSGFPLLILRN